MASGANITPLAAFVPFLVHSLASGRQSKRLEAMLGELQLLTEQNAEKLKDMTDDQYKVVNEAISAAFYTIDLEKTASAEDIDLILSTKFIAAKEAAHRMQQKSQ